LHTGHRLTFSNNNPGAPESSRIHTNTLSHCAGGDFLGGARGRASWGTEAGVLRLPVQQPSQGAGKRCFRAGRAAVGRRAACPGAQHLSTGTREAARHDPEQQLRLRSVGAVS